MWNYDFILPGFIILSIFIIYYYAHPRLPIKLNFSFLRILTADFCVILSDYIASAALEHSQHFSPFFLKAINILYFILFMYRSFSFFIFTEDAFNLRVNRKTLWAIMSNIVFLVCEFTALLNFFFDTIFSISPTGSYSRSQFYNVIYICAYLYLGLSFFCIIRYRNKLSKRAVLSLTAYNLTLFTGYFLRIFFPTYLIMNLFTLFAIVIIFLSFENPIMFLAGKINAFNKKALYTIFEEIDKTKPPVVLAFVINNYNEMREIYSSSQMDRGITLINQYITKRHPELLRFYLHDGRFVLIGKENTSADKIKAEFTERFKKSWCAGKDVDIFIEPKFVQFDSFLSFENPVKILNALFIALKEAENLDNVNISINNTTLASIEENTQIKRSVEKAVETNTVEMFLQPLMNTNDYTLVGAEALARIRDDEGNLIPPVKFIPIAEKNGRINSLGEQMFEKACQFIHSHDIEAMGLSWINVNLSPIQFLRPDLNQRFTRILEKYGVKAELIHLEITEESMIDYTLLQKQIRTMKSSGFQFVLDDYGSGYSNVTRLKSCPFINVKLDKELVQDYAKGQDKFLPTLVQTFKQMDFTVTAEGVETLDMVEAMAKIGCDYLQGYYFSKPLPSEDFAKTYSN